MIQKTRMPKDTLDIIVFEMIDLARFRGKGFTLFYKCGPYPHQYGCRLELAMDFSKEGKIQTTDIMITGWQTYLLKVVLNTIKKCLWNR